MGDTGNRIWLWNIPANNFEELDYEMVFYRTSELSVRNTDSLIHDKLRTARLATQPHITSLSRQHQPLRHTHLSHLLPSQSSYTYYYAPRSPDQNPPDQATHDERLRNGSRPVNIVEKDGRVKQYVRCKEKSGCGIILQNTLKPVVYKEAWKPNGKTKPPR